MFENNIFTNPIGWADGLVGTKTNYILNTVVLIFVGIAFALLAVSLEGKLADIIFVLLIVYIVIVPLFCLKAMRRLILERKANIQK